MSRREVAISLALLAVTTAGVGVAAPPMGRSIHAEELARHGHLPRPTERRLPPLVPLDGDAGPKRVVYGYLPYWTSDLATIRWSALTHVAWFSVGINPDGSVGVKHDWPDTEAVMVAHTHGVKVDLAFTLFDNDAITALCTSPTARAKAVASMIDEMEAGGADGISLDFEFVAAPAKAGFVALVDELRQALVKRGHPDAEISIAGPTVDWNGGLDMPALLANADWFFVMGYDYFWSGSSFAGPSGILRVSNDWLGKTTLSSTRTLAEYTATIAPPDRKKLIWGVPYYGREWTTTTNAIAAPTIDSVGAVTYKQAKKDLADGFAESLWDEGTMTPWYRWQEAGVWHQVYFDDGKSLAAKYELALAQDVGGVGMWALNYDAPHEELWDLLETTFAEEPVRPLGHRDNPVVVDAFPFQDARSTVNGPSHYFNFYACSPTSPEYGREWVYRVDVCQPGTLSASVPSYADRDPDIHLLDAAEQEACLARDDTDVAVPVKPGRYYVVVDSYVSKGVAKEGAFEVAVDFAPEVGSKACAEHLTCDAGDCVCPAAGQTDCDGACVDTATSLDHCGACGNACSEGESCVDGACEGGAEEPVGAGGAGMEGSGGSGLAFSGDVEAGCACGAGASTRTAGGAAAALLVGLACVARRGGRRRRRD